MIYLDPSSIVALTVRDARGRTLARQLNADQACVITSVLNEVETAATLRREHPDRVHHLPRTLAAISRYALDEGVRRLAGALAGDATPTAAAVHVATALVVLGDDAESFITFNPATARAASARHLPVRRPSWWPGSP